MCLEENSTEINIGSWDGRSNKSFLKISSIEYLIYDIFKQNYQCSNFTNQCIR